MRSLGQGVPPTRRLQRGWLGGRWRWVTLEQLLHYASVPGWGRSPGEGNGSPLQYSCLENPKDRGVCHVHGVAKSRTQLSDQHFPLLGNW